MKNFYGRTMTHLDISISPTGVDQTAQVQAAMDRAKDQPVRITFEAGDHHVAGLRMRSNVAIILSQGARLCFATTYDAYAHTEVSVEAEQSNRAMIVANDVTNVSISGPGSIWCNGSTTFSRGDDEVMGTRIPYELRPRVMVLDGCQNVTLTDLRVEDSPMWTLHFVNCRDMHLSHLTILNDLRMPNTDGIVIDGCQNVEINDCEIRTADDGVVLKTSQRADGTPLPACENIIVRDSLIESRSCALKLGTESFADFRDITFARCTIDGSNRGLGIFSRDGGTVDGVRFEDITLTCTETPDGFWGSGEAITINSLDRRPHLRPAGDIKNITASGIFGSMNGAINIVAQRAGMITDVTLTNIQITQQPGPLGTGLCYDLRPTPKDLEPSPDAAGRINAWRLGDDGRVIGLTDYPGGMPGLFAKNVRGIALTDVRVDRPSALPDGWNADTVVLVDTETA